MLHRHARPAVAGTYLAGAVSGAAVTLASLLVLGGLVSPIPDRYRQIAALTGLALLALHYLRFVCLDLPQRTYQIPRETFRDAPSRAAFRFAFELGLGFRTYVTAISPYALGIAVVLAMPSSLGLAILTAAAAAAGFGSGRSVIVASQAVRRQPAIEHPERWLRVADGLALVCAAAFVAVG